MCEYFPKSKLFDANANFNQFGRAMQKKADLKNVTDVDT